MPNVSNHIKETTLAWNAALLFYSVAAATIVNLAALTLVWGMVFATSDPWPLQWGRALCGIAIMAMLPFAMRSLSLSARRRPAFWPLAVAPAFFVAVNAASGQLGFRLASGIFD